MSDRALVRLLIIITAAAATVRLLQICGLHPLNWDEIEFFRATDWVRQGLVPYRDFWEHHTPLQWYLFAPFAALTKSEGAMAIVWMRIAQVPLWIATFWLANLWMKRSGLDATSRWAAIALTCCSSMFMLAAVEYRVDVLGCALYIAGVVMLQQTDPRWSTSRSSAASGILPSFAAGAIFCLAGFANLRLGPLLALTVMLDAVIDRSQQRWTFNRRSVWVVLGVLVTFALGLGFFAACGAIGQLYQHVWYENYLGDKYAGRIPWAFVHRLLVPFGIRIYGGNQAFEWSGIDIAGAVLLILGFVGLVRALGRFRRPDETFFFAALQLFNMLFIAKMKFVYHYHLEIVILMMLPFVAAEIERGYVRRAIPAFAIIALIISSAVVILRGKERDFAYQDTIMREAHAHTPVGGKVFDGVGWAIRRTPAYRFWFLPDLIRQLVPHGHAPAYRVQEWIVDPPAAVITDRNASVWLAQNPPLAVHAIHHYLPLWRNLWLPALSGVTGANDKPLVWMVPVTGDYRVYASPMLASHPWFRHPLNYRAAERTEVRLGQPSAVANVVWYVNNKPAAPLNGVLKLRKLDSVTLVGLTPERIGVLLIPGTERVWFRQPPPGVTLDSEAARVTHVPDLRLLFSAPIPTSSE